MSNLKIEYVKKEDLKPYVNNAKIHTAEQIEQIKKSIQEFGFNDPVAVWKDNVIIEGHGRLLAVMEMDDVDKVPIIRLDDLTDEQRKAYTLVHNKLTINTPFELSLLEEELEKIKDIEMGFYGFKSLQDIEEQLEDFFIPDEDSVPKAKSEDVKIIIKPTNENKEELIEFLKEQEYEYEEK